MPMLFVNIVVAHTAIVAIGKPGSKITELKSRPSIGRKYVHYSEFTQGDVVEQLKQGKFTAETVTSTIRLSGKYVLQGFANDDADLLTGIDPPNEVYQANIGDSIMVAWTTNGHSGVNRPPMTFHYKPEIPPTSPVTIKNYFENNVDVQDVKGYTSAPFSEGGNTVCQEFTENHDGYLSVVGDYPGAGGQPGVYSNDYKICSATIKLPPNLKPGLQKIIMSWYAEFNPIMFFDAIYVQVGGADSPPPVGTPQEPANPQPVLVGPTPPLIEPKPAYTPDKCNK